VPTAPVQVLLLSGPAGAGKSTLGWEIAAPLRRLGIAHVLLDTAGLTVPGLAPRAIERAGGGMARDG
jgi:hypothetical protein